MKPRRHIPAALREALVEARPEGWGIGKEHRAGEYGMLAGPWPDEGSALDFVGDEGSVIIHFLEDGSDHVAWRWDEDAWLEERPDPPPVIEPDTPLSTRSIVIHTDGSCSVKTKRGGWAFIIRHGDRMVDRCGFKGKTTISEMELQAIINSLHFLKPGPQPISIYSDSQYAVNALTKWGELWAQTGWKTSTGKDVAHRKLIEQGLDLVAKHRTLRNVDIMWIRGHAGHHDNELADGLAGQARIDHGGSWTRFDRKFLDLFKQL